MGQSTGLIIHIPLNSFEVTNIQIGGKMKDKTIIFGIFYDIFAASPSPVLLRGRFKDRRQVI